MHEFENIFYKLYCNNCTPHPIQLIASFFNSKQQWRVKFTHKILNFYHNVSLVLCVYLQKHKRYRGPWVSFGAGQYHKWVEESYRTRRWMDAEKKHQNMWATFLSSWLYCIWTFEARVNPLIQPSSFIYFARYFLKHTYIWYGWRDRKSRRLWNIIKSIFL